MDFQTVADGVIDPARDVQQELLAKPETLYMLAAAEVVEYPMVLLAVEVLAVEVLAEVEVLALLAVLAEVLILAAEVAAEEPGFMKMYIGAVLAAQELF